MDAEDSKIIAFHALKPSNYGFLQRWWLDRSPVREDQDGTVLELQFVSGKSDSSILQIRFKTVIQLRLNTLDKLNGYVLDIKPVQKKQWEDGNYLVSEAEYDAFSFICKDFTAQYVSSDIKYCSFCGKSRHEVSKMIAGQNVFICSECLELSIKILSGDATEETTQDNS